MEGQASAKRKKTLFSFFKKTDQYSESTPSDRLIEEQPSIPTVQLPPISSPETVHPSTSNFELQLTTSIERDPDIPDRFKKIGKIPSKKKTLIIPDIHLHDFLHLEEEARTIGASAPEKNYYGTLDKKFGQFIFLEGAEPTMVQTAFHCGLIKMIIPGKEFEELKLIDSGLLQSLKDFSKYVIKDQDLQMILKINSTIPFWDKDNNLVKGYHHIQIKTAHEAFLDRPNEGEATCVNDPILNEWRALSFQRILTGLKTINGESKVKVNHSSKFILMTSKTSSHISTKSIKILCNFEKSFYNVFNTPASYKGQLCSALKSSLGKYHACQWCEGTDKKAEIMKTFVDAETSKLESAHSATDSGDQSE